VQDSGIAFRTHTVEQEIQVKNGLIQQEIIQD